MGKRANQSKPVKPEASSLPAAPSPSLEQPPIETPSVPAPGAATAEEKPVEVFGVLPSAGTSVVITHDGNTFAEGDVDPEAVFSEHTQNTGASAPEVIAGQGELQGEMQQQPPAEKATPPEVQAPALDLSSHPAIELARRHKTGAGRPREGLPAYYTPPPFDVFAKKK